MSKFSFYYGDIPNETKVGEGKRNYPDIKILLKGKEVGTIKYQERKELEFKKTGRFTFVAGEDQVETEYDFDVEKNYTVNLGWNREKKELYMSMSKDSWLDIVAAIIGVLCLIALPIIIFIFVTSDNSETTIRNGSWAEQMAVEDIPEDAYYWGTLRSNEISCNATSETDDGIILVKCTTNNSELISYYGSSTIWYGYLESADGMSYWHYSSSSSDTVLSNLRY